MTDRSARTVLDQFLYPDIVNLVFSFVEKPIKRVPINRLEVAYFRFYMDIWKNGYDTVQETFVVEQWDSVTQSTIGLARMRSGSDWFYEQTYVVNVQSCKLYEYVRKRVDDARLRYPYQT